MFPMTQEGLFKFVAKAKLGQFEFVATGVFVPLRQV